MTAAAGPSGSRRVVVVTGGGAGIGAAIATELGRRGAFVATVDPMVSLDGSSTLPEAEETTAGRIVALGGAAEAFPISVTDRAAVEGLFAALVADHGRLDAVVNVAGITRPTSFVRGSEEDWRAVLAVHLGGYLEVLRAALPIMAEAGHGRILGVTSGSGWRAADAGAYSCAKRAVAALTWQLGRVAPPGVTVNAISPIAVTRMVTEALARAAAAAPKTSSPGGGSGSSAGGSGSPRGGSASTGGLSLGSMPEPEALAPLAAHLVDEALDWMSGHVLFTAGSEVALVDPPRLLEVVGLGDATSPAALLEAAAGVALAAAERAQASVGGANVRLPEAWNDEGVDLPAPAVRTCAVVADRPEVLAAVTEALEPRGVRCTAVPTGGVGGAVGDDETVAADGSSFGSGGEALARVGPVDAVVVAVGGSLPATDADVGWERVLAEHDGLVARIPVDAGWARAVADASAASGTPMRLVTLVDARTAGGRSRAQAAAQLSRAAARATDERVTAVAVSVEAADLGVGDGSLGAVAAHLVTSPALGALSGAELVLGEGWFGLRSHPRPGTSVAVAGPDLPPWFDDVLQGLVARPEPPA